MLLLQATLTAEDSISGLEARMASLRQRNVSLEKVAERDRAAREKADKEVGWVIA